MFKSIKTKSEEILFKRLSALERAVEGLYKSARTNVLFVSSGLGKPFEILIADLAEYKAALSQGIGSVEDVSSGIDTMENILNLCATYNRLFVSRGLPERDLENFRRSLSNISKIMHGLEPQDGVVDDAELSRQSITAQGVLVETGEANAGVGIDQRETENDTSGKDSKAVWNFTSDERYQDIFIRQPELINESNINSPSKDGRYPGQTVFWRLCAVGQDVLVARPELLSMGDVNATPENGSCKGESALACLAATVIGRELLAAHPDLLMKGNLDAAAVEGKNAGKTVLWHLTDNSESLPILAAHPELLAKGNLDAKPDKGLSLGHTVLWNLAHRVEGRAILAAHPELLKKGDLHAAPEDELLGFNKGQSVLFCLANSADGRAILIQHPDILNEVNFSDNSKKVEKLRVALDATEEGRAILLKHTLQKDWLEEVTNLVAEVKGIASEIEATKKTEDSPSRRSFFSKPDKLSEARVQEIITQKASLEKHYLDLVVKLDRMKLGIQGLLQASGNANESKDKAFSELEHALVELKKSGDELEQKRRAMEGLEAKVSSLSIESSGLYEANAVNRKLAKEFKHEKQELERQVETLKAAKEKAEDSAAFAHRTLDVMTSEFSATRKALHATESDLGLRTAQLQRNVEDLKRLNTDILELAELAESLHADKEKYYSESQYGHFRQKCDALQRRRGELMQRVHSAEKSAKQAALEVGYEDSAQRGQIRKLEAEIQQLKEKTLSLQQECSQLKSTDIVTENVQLKEKLKAERDKKFTGVLDNLENAAVKGVIVLEKRNQALEAEVAQLKAEREAQLPVVAQTTPSKLAEGIKKVAICAGFALAAVATVAALGILGAAAVVYALPLLGIGLAIAAGGYLISKLVELRHQDRLALQALEPEIVEPVHAQRNATPVKELIEKRDASSPEASQQPRR